MPVKKSAFKALAQSKTKALRNRKVKSDIDALTRKIRKSVEGKDSVKASEWLVQAIKKIDKASQKKILKKNTAARKKSRLSKAVAAISRK